MPSGRCLQVRRQRTRGRTWTEKEAERLSEVYMCIYIYRKGARKEVGRQASETGKHHSSRGFDEGRQTGERERDEGDGVTAANLSLIHI